MTTSLKLAMFTVVFGFAVILSGCATRERPHLSSAGVRELEPRLLSARSPQAAARRPSHQLWIVVPDRATSIHTVPLKVVGSSMLTDVQAEEILSNVVLRSASSQLPVRYRVVRRHELINESIHANTLELALLDQVAGRVFVGFIGIPEWLELSGKADLIVVDDGILGVYFEQESHPAAIALRVCMKNVGEYTFVVDWSEDLRAAGGEPFLELIDEFGNVHSECNTYALGRFVQANCWDIDASGHLWIRAAVTSTIAASGGYLYNHVVDVGPLPTDGCAHASIDD